MLVHSFLTVNWFQGDAISEKVVVVFFEGYMGDLGQTVSGAVRDTRLISVPLHQPPSFPPLVFHVGDVLGIMLSTCV